MFSIVVLVATLLIVANSVDAAAPDLVVSSVALSGPVVSGQSATVIYTVINQGTGSVSNNVCWYDRVYLCTNATLSSSAEYIYWNPCGPVAAGASYTNSYTFTLPTLQPGTHYLIAVTDTGDSIPGENYANNTNAPVAFTVTAPDLVVTNVAVLSPTVSGQNFTLAYTVANQGTGPADGCWYDRLYLCTNTTLSSGIYWSQWNPCGPVAVGGTYGYTNTETLPTLQPGTYYWIAITDTGDSVPGENYNNNTNTPVAFTVTAPDLVVTNVAVLSPTVSGQSFTLAYTVANRGTGPADGCWYDRLYLCTNITLSSGIYWWQWNPCGPVAAGGTYGYTNTETLPSLQPGTYYWIAITDTGDSVPGENYANNTNAPVAFTVTAPDLVVTNVVVLSPAVSGQPVSLSWTVLNQGNGPASGSWVDWIYLCTNTTLSSSINGWYWNASGPVAAGATYTNTSCSTCITLPSLQSGTYYWIAVTDNGHSISESNFSNNTNAPVAFTVTAPDLVVSNFTMLNSAVSGQPVSLSWTVLNQGNGPASGSWVDWIYLCTNTTLSSSINGWYWNASGPVAAGATYINTSCSTCITLPSLQSGTYYWIAVTDTGHSVSETNYNNNTNAPVAFTLKAPNLGGSIIVASNGDVVVTQLGYITAADSDSLYLYSPTGYYSANLIVNNFATPVLTTVDLGYFTAGTELVFEMCNLNTGYCYLTGPASRNVDNTVHDTVVDNYTINGITGTYVAFEDLQYGGDKDYNDLIFLVSNVYGLPTNAPPPTITNVRASQRFGTSLVDIYYDLGGNVPPVLVSAIGSTNAGAAYNLPVLSLTGDGIGTVASVGLNRHIVWNAGTDFPNHFSTTMRLLLSDINNSAAQASSVIFTLNTFTTATGGLVGTVLNSNGSPVTNAQVRIESPPFSTNTLNNGTFTLTNIPVGNGYVLDVSAAGYAPKRLSGVNVRVGANAWGNIILANVGGPISLIPLVPDVNPTMTTVEQGGTAYRYYQMVSSTNHGAPLPSIPVTVQIQGGAAISQTNLSVPNYWQGQVAGVSDANGLVCVAIPSSFLNTNGISQTVQLSISNVVLQTFQTQVVPRQYDQVWKQAVGGGVGIEAEVDTSAESRLHHTIVGGIITAETISRIRQEKIQIGLDAGFDIGLSEKLSDVSPSGGGGVGTGVGGGVFFSAILSSSFTFDPNTTDPTQNAMKLYVDLGNVLTGIPIGSQFYDYVDGIVAPTLLATNLNSVECDLQYGAYAEGEVKLEIDDNEFQEGLPIGGQVSASGGGSIITGLEMTFGANTDIAGIIGKAGDITVSGDFFSSTAGPYASVGLGGEQKQFTWIQPSTQPIQINTVEADMGTPNPLPAWQQYDPSGLNANYAREFTTKTWAQTGNGSLTNYERSVFASEVGAQVGFNFDVIISLNFNLELDRGAEAVNERGVALQRYQFSHWPTESYPPITTNLFPTQSWPSILSQWGANATGPIGQAVNQIATTVGAVGNTIVTNLGATLTVAGSDFDQGASGIVQVISSGVSWISHLSLAIPAGKPHPLGGSGGNAATYLPPDGFSNYVYGIDGVYRFTSTNAFNGTATLTIAYNPTDITGLDPTQLQIYQLPDGTNRWRLIGGVVNTVSNTVTATITNLGTYAIAPLLPTGDLQLILSTNALTADGVSTMTVIVTNLMLNNGNVATQQWLFTATADGVQITNQDCDTNLSGIQVVSTNDAVTLVLRAPSGGTVAHVHLASVAGDAYGSATINLIDTTPPATPTNVIVTAGQSRIWVSWATNSEPDLAGYRVYYNAGIAGPPWSGTAAIEGSPSPVQVTGTNCLLRGLILGTNYFVAVSAVDTTGNESPLSPAYQVTTTQVPPSPPTGVAVQFGSDGTNVLMWALSEDDGYNDRDVTNYYIWRAILPGGSYVKVGQVAAGIGVYTEINPVVSSTQSVSYAVSAVTASGSTSTQVVATVIAPSSVVVNTNVVIGPSKLLSNGQFQLTVNGGVSGQSYVLLASTNLVDWTPISGFVDTNPPVTIYDPDAAKYRWRFYRIGPMSVAPAITLSLNSGQLFGSNGINFALYSLPGLNYEIEASTNLVNWTTITNFVSTNSTFYFSDPAAKNFKQRFYRAVMQ